MRLHIMQDEKVTGRAIRIFEEVFPLDNIYIILLERNRLTPFYVSSNIKNVFFLHYNSKIFLAKTRNINSFSHIIFHFLSDDGINYLNKIKHPSIYWIAWGSDLYSGLLEQRGYQLYEEKNIEWICSSKRMPCFIYQSISTFIKKRKSQQMFKAVKRVRYFSPDSMYDEYPLLLSYYPELSHLEYKNIFYYPIDDILGSELLQKKSIGNDIIVGNSASMTGNHFSIFKRLDQLSTGDRKIIVPLSYGKIKYQKLVIEEGKRIFKDKFKAILDFMPLQQYNELLLSANIFIYGNWRQEAVGNILIALYLGGKVFLDERNLLLSFYKSKGLILFNINELSESYLNNPLSTEEKLRNREILINLYSKENLLNTVKQNFF